LTKNTRAKQGHISLARFLVCSAVFAMLISSVRGADAVKEIPELGGKESVMIIATPKSGIGPFTVRLKPVINEKLREPVRYLWWFGDGEESMDEYPPPHYYDIGRYSVVLEVTDDRGKHYSASVTINARSPG